MAKTLKDLAKEAIQVQDACNLSGVVHSFARCMSDMMDLVPGATERNEHPICKLWSDKVAHLTGTQTIGNDSVMEAYTEVSKLAKE